jgi:hypothetical protein
MPESRCVGVILVKRGRMEINWPCAGCHRLPRMRIVVSVPKIIVIIHLLGLAPAGYLTAPDNGPRAGCGVVLVNATVVTLCH